MHDVFHHLGTIPNPMLKICFRGSSNSQTFGRLGDTPSGPAALLVQSPPSSPHTRTAVVVGGEGTSSVKMLAVREGREQKNVWGAWQSEVKVGWGDQIC